MQVSSVRLNSFYSTKKADSRAISRANATDTISFRANKFDKNPRQFLSIAPEHKGIGLKNYDEGGLACVAQEAPESWTLDLGADIRSALPYHATDNKDGLMKLAVFEDAEEIPELLPPDLSTVRNVSPNYVPRENERFVVVNSAVEIDKETKQKKGYKFLVLEPTDVKGTITTLSEWDLTTEPLDYKFFKQVLSPKQIREGMEPKYFVHTKQVALMPRCYGLGSTYQPGQVTGEWWDLYYANFCRAIADALPQLAEKENFNPANIWMHDRPAFAFQYEVAKRSANGDKFYDGLRMQSQLHNPGHSYQGYFEDPIGCLHIAFDEKEFERLQESDDYYELRVIAKKDYKKLTAAEIKRRNEILGDYFKNILDEYKLPNTTMIAIANSKLNSANSTVGTVSMNYGKEMKSTKLQGIADGLTKPLNDLKETIDITNGNKPAALELDQDGKFGQGGNGLTFDKENYTKYSPYLSEDGKVMNYSPEDRIKESIDKKHQHDDLTAKIEEKEPLIKKHEKKLKKMKQKLAESKDLPPEKRAKLKQAYKDFRGKLEAEKDDFDKDVKDKRKLDCIFTFKTVKEAKQANKEWLLNLVGDCVDDKGNPDNQKLRGIFYNTEQLNKGLKVHGYLSKYEKGDKVFSSWGRSDEQKGFSTLVQGFYKYLTEKGDAKLENEKKHAKLIFGSGGLWKTDATERKIIYEYIDKIRTLDGGKYAGNICYVEGFFPNKLVAASDWTIFTSRYEPCGITPLESFAAGVPVLSIRTGGAPDFVRHFDTSKMDETLNKIEKDSKSLSDKTKAKAVKAKVEDYVGIGNGILTPDAFMLSDKTIKERNNPAIDKDLDSKDPVELDSARREVLSDEIASLFKQANAIPESVYDKMSKNACEQHIEWSKNKDYNGGKSANYRYMDEVYRLKPDTLEFAEPRSTRPLKKLTKKFGHINGDIVLDEDPIRAAILKYKKQSADGESPSFKGIIQKYATLSSIEAYSNAYKQNAKKQ